MMLQILAVYISGLFHDFLWLCRNSIRNRNFKTQQTYRSICHTKRNFHYHFIRHDDYGHSHIHGFIPVASGYDNAINFIV